VALLIPLFVQKLEIFTSALLNLNVHVILELFYHIFCLG
jgi:hypothetical protein